MSFHPASSSAGLRGYTLVICEKPDAARRVAEALSATAPEVLMVKGVQVFRLEDARGRRYVVCAAAGHLYGVSDTVKNRRVYPVVDLEWFPLSAISKKGAKRVPSRILAIRTLSDEASEFVNACDLDTEGETIGYNVLRYACRGREVSALRARFSSLTKEEVVKAFEDGVLAPADRLANAGRLRHVIDFLWGVNLSRALSESFRTSNGFRTVSMGRVQGPALNFVVEREIDVSAFVPTPYWTASGSFSKGGAVFQARYRSTPVISTQRAAYEIKRACDGEEGVVESVSRRTVGQRPPPPFNLADLQKDAFTLFGYSPSKTLQVAERLYLGAMISYPRTASQRLPELDYSGLLSKLATMPEYSKSVEQLLSRGTLRPVEGREVDPAHPAIYPTGEGARRRPLEAEERRVFDLVVRRFLSCFGDEAIHEVRSAEILVGEHRFGMETRSVLAPGWMSLAAGWRWVMDRPTRAVDLRDGERVHVDAISVEECLRTPAARYDQGTLLEKMEREGIGTKATRADIISTLLDRGYVAGRALVPTEFGFALIEAMREHCPQIISTSLTREIESWLEGIEGSGDSGAGFFERMLSTLLAQLGEVRSHADEIATRMGGSASEEAPRQVILGRCPMCKEGKLWVVRSRRSGKRFVGCTNYCRGCRASAPLPQRGAIKAATKPCRNCGWPVVYVRLVRRPWRLCVNDRCPRKVNVYVMQDLQKNAKR